MLSLEYDLKMHANRSLEKILSHYSDVKLENFDAYYNILTAVLSMCDQGGVKMETKYYTKRIYDTFALKNPQASPLLLEFAASNCLRLAIKFNESPEYHDQLTIEKWQKIVSPEFTYDHFIVFEFLLHQDKEYSINFTTPYDYFGVYSKVFPITAEHRKSTMSMLDISFTIPELMFYNAEQIFFGCLLAAHKGSEVEKGWILSQTFFKQEGLEVAKIVQNIYKEQVEAALNAQFQ